MIKLPQGSSVLCLPADYTHLTVGFEAKTHSAVDYGFLHGHEYPTLVAISDAVVLQQRNDGSAPNRGGYVTVIGWTDGSNDWFAEYMHNRYYNEVAVGTVVKQGQKIATMGNTGDSRGVHVHLVLYRAPLGSKFSNSSLRSYRLDANQYCFRFPHQQVAKNNKLIKDKPEIGAITKVKGTLTVTASAGLRERTGPSIQTPTRSVHSKGSVLRYTGWLSDGKYYWYQLENGNYSAYRVIGGEKFAEYKDDGAPTPKPDPKPTPPKPAPKDEYITVAGKHTLYKASTGTGRGSYYGAEVQNLRSRQMKVLARANGRTQVQAGFAPFDVPSFWIETSSKPTPKPPAPKTEYAVVAGKQTLYTSSTGTSYYGAKVQSLRSRDMKVLAKANGRIQVSTAGFRNSTNTGPAFDRPNFWVLGKSVRVYSK